MGASAISGSVVEGLMVALIVAFLILWKIRGRRRRRNVKS